MYGEPNLASGRCPLHSLTLQVKMLWDTCTKNYCNGSKKDAPPLVSFIQYRPLTTPIVLSNQFNIYYLSSVSLSTGHPCAGGDTHDSCHTTSHIPPYVGVDGAYIKCHQ